MKIQKLPVEVSSKLQSSVNVTDAVQCVLELVYNSLDAGATGIAVRIDLKTYQIRVIDNGKGIGKEDLELVGERFMTSKFQSFADIQASVPPYGFRGQALSSLQKLSRTLRIETKPEEDGLTYVKTFQNNKASLITTVLNEKAGTGTTVFIDDFMYTMPVRRKRINEVFEIEEIKRYLQCLAIIHFKVCFTLRNENKSVIVLQTSQASSVLESLTNLYGKTFAHCLKTLYYQEENYEISGYLSLKPQDQNNVQLIYINKRIITKGVMHKFINNLIKKNSRKKIYFSESPTSKLFKSCKSTCNAFILEIKCPRSYYELFTNIRKTKVEFKNWKVLLKCIHKAVRIAYKEEFTSESLIKSQDGNENKAKTYKSKKVFGTSFLFNVVKGAPVKRELGKKKDSKNKKNVHTIENNDSFKTLSIPTKNLTKECTNDSFESPIPKKNFKNKMLQLQSKKTESCNQSFVEFYEWLKAKSETDTNAFNLYNDFLQSKNKTSYPKEVTESKSPVFVRKQKKSKQMLSPKKIPKKKPKKAIDDVSAVNEQITIMSQEQLKIFPNGHLRMKKAVQFASEMKSSLFEHLNFDVISSGNFRFENHSRHSAFKQTDGLIALDRIQKQIGCNYSFSSLPSSEAQFMSLIRFRNLSESFFRPPSDAFSLSQIAFSSSTSDSWASHYQNLELNDVEFHKKNRNLKNYVFSLKKNEKNKDLDCVHFYKFSEVDLSKLRKKLKRTEAVQDVEIQVDMTETVLPVKKVSANVQTSQEIPESHSFESSYTFNQEHDMQAVKCGQIGTQKTKNLNCLEEIIFEEPPNPDFWNSSQAFFNRRSTPVFNSNLNKTNEKCLNSNGFISGEKSISSSKIHNERSRTEGNQSFTDIRTDSLTKMGDPVKCDAPDNCKLSDSNSETLQLPKTIPIEQIECDVLKSVGSGFCLADRCDCVPKGFSPLFLKQGSAKLCTLSPREKNRIQFTIDSTQNEFLTNIKWQDEITGEFFKPVIRDGILFEMHQKSEESAAHYENPVLSASLSYYAVKIHSLLHSFSFTKELLSTVEILGQLDKKFIVAKIKIFAPKKMELISLFDQHAVDERIKLEELVAENILANGKFNSTCLNSPLHCVLPESDVGVILDLKEKILNFGLNAELVNETTICFREIPTFLINKHEKNLKNKKESSLSNTLKNLVLNIINEIRETRGAVPKIPKVIHNAFCLEACHKAVKFNKALTVENMIEMISKLQNCKLPFQCAHGRPSVIPIIDLEDFKPKMEENEISFDLEDIKKFLK